jgi:hypothetical protein
MFAGRKTARGVNAQIDRRVIKYGPRKAFRVCGRLMLSSGPHEKYLDDVEPGFSKNDIRAEFQAAAFETTIIGKTPIGRYVFRKDRIYVHFGKLYPGKKNERKRQKETEAVESHISRLFVCSSNGHAHTAVCGANKKRIFYRVELHALAVDIPDLIDALLKNDDITHVNEVPVDKIRTLYNTGKHDAAYRLICLSELRLMARCARRAEEKSKTALALWFWKEYAERKELYLLERKDAWGSDPKGMRPIYNLDANARLLRRNKILDGFKARILARAAAAGKAISKRTFAPMTVRTIRGQALALL